jgi:hypothetical protein
MATLAQRITDLATRIATELKAHKVFINGNAADLTGLTTTAKSNIVAAINEVNAKPSGGASINDSTVAVGSVWSSSKTNSEIGSQITAQIGVLTTGAPAALNTLDELAAALGDDANFATTITTALGNRVRVDTAAQGLTLTQKQNARTNIDAYGSVEIGNPDADFVATFNSGLA